MAYDRRFLSIQAISISFAMLAFIFYTGDAMIGMHMAPRTDAGRRLMIITCSPKTIFSLLSSTPVIECRVSMSVSRSGLHF